MANPRKPRKGSMSVWPRKRANKMYARVRGWTTVKSDKTLLGFAGYKAGMTHAMGMDVKKTSMTKGEEVRVPLTIIECPPLRIFSVRFYTKGHYGTRVEKDFAIKPGKEVARKVTLAKAYKDVKELDAVKAEDYMDISLVVYTTPKETGLKKTPELFELKLSGSISEKLEFAKANIDKDITIDQVFKEGQFVDVHAVTTGKGTQGPIKRFRIGLKQHKTEKGRRQPGSRGGWSEQQHVMYRTAYSGQMGFHQRVQYNVQVYKISNQPSEVNPKDGFPHYGVVKSTFVLVKGSVPGVKKRLLILTQPMRAPKKEDPILNLTHISTQSKQGR